MEFLCPSFRAFSQKRAAIEKEYAQVGSGIIFLALFCWDNLLISKLSQCVFFSFIFSIGYYGKCVDVLNQFGLYRT